MNVKGTVASVIVLLAMLVMMSMAILHHMGMVVTDSQEKMTAVLTVDDHLSDFISSLKDVETGQRGFLLTDKSYYLDPYHKALQEIPSELNDLNKDAAAGQLASTDVDHMAHLTHEKLNELGQTIALHDQKGPAAALVVVDTDFGKHTMDNIRADVDGIEAGVHDEFLRAKKLAEETEVERSAAFFALGLLNLIALVGAYRTISFHIRAQEEQKEFLATTLASIGDAVIMTDPRGHVTFLNHEAVRLTGWDNQRAAGKQLTEVFKIINEESRKPVENPVDKVLRLGVVVGLANHTLLISRDGREIPIDDSAAPIRHNQGPILGVVLIFRDFSTHKMAQEALLRSNEELAQFAYVASHDLQEPLRTISNYVDMLLVRKKDILDADIKTYLDFIYKASLRSQELVRSLLEYANITAKDYPFQLTDLRILLEQVLGNIKAAIEENGAKVTHDFLPTLPVDPVQIKQLFQNLISNSIKYRGHQAPRVHVSASHDHQQWTFAIKDNGIGIEPEYLERIFMIFKRLHSASEYPGVGIGLAVCKKIIQRHGGRIWVESVPQQGSTFYFTLPVKRD